MISVKHFSLAKVKRRNLMKRIRLQAVAVRQSIARCRCQTIHRLTVHRNAKVSHVFCFSEKNPHQSVASVQSCDQIGHLFFLHFILFRLRGVRLSHLFFLDQDKVPHSFLISPAIICAQFSISLRRPSVARPRPRTEQAETSVVPR